MPLQIQPLIANFIGLNIPAGWTNINEAVVVDKPYGGNWATARIRFPADCAEDARGFCGEPVRITLGGQFIFQGRILEWSPTIDGNEDYGELIAHDIRWDLSRMRVGQLVSSDIGGVFWQQALSGWAHVGHIVHFNPNNHGNRSPGLLPTNFGGLATHAFGTYPGCVRWTLIDMLRFIVEWHVPQFLVPYAALAALPNWQRSPSDVYLYGMTLLQAITQIAHLAGESWHPRYTAGDPEYARITVNGVPSLWPNGGPTVFTAPLFPAAAGATSDMHFREHVCNQRGHLRITDSIDHLEVHSGKALVETIHSTETMGGRPPLLLRMDHIAEDYWISFRVDVSVYESHQLGGNLQEGSRPKRWMRYNNTRLESENAVNTYLPAGDPRVAMDSPRPLLPDNAVWIAHPAFLGGERVLCTGGFDILIDESIIQFRDYLDTLTPEGEHEPLDLTEPIYAEQLFQVWVNITTETEQEIVRLSQPPAVYHLPNTTPANRERWHIEMISASHIRPRYRFAAQLPDADGTGIINTGPDVYYDPLPALDDMLGTQLPTRNRRESSGTLHLLDHAVPPALELGMGLSTAPDNTQLEGNEVVTHLRWVFESQDHTSITYTNNLARVLQTDMRIQ